MKIRGCSNPLPQSVALAHFCRWAAIFAIFTMLAAGCAQQHYFETHSPLRDGTAAHLPPAVDHPRELAMFTGDGLRIGWPAVLAAAAWADVVIIGEQHDDPVGHAVELAVVEDVTRRCPQSALSMEMLERDEQPLVDDYMDGIIDAATLAKETFSEKWAGEGSWKDWYQPIIDAAKSNGSRVIAANAPRRYVRLANKEGYDRLRSLPANRRAFFDLPMKLTDDGYRQRFFDLMKDANHGMPPSTAPDKPVESEEVRQQQIENGFRSQLLWDATMGASIVRAKRAGAAKVVHVIGQFHCDFNGGTVQQVHARMPNAKILVISMQRDDVESLRDEDRGRADIVIYTGKPPPEKDETKESAPPTQPAESQPATP